MTRHNDENGRDLDRWVSGDLEGVRGKDVPGYMRFLATRHYFKLGAKAPDLGTLSLVRLNMQKHAARARRADAIASTLRLLALAKVLGALVGLLWLLNRLLN